MQKKGAIYIARQMLESDIFYNKPPEWLKIWLYILLKVNWKESKQFKRGEGYFCWNEIKGELKGVSANQWKHCCDWLFLAKQIDKQKTPRGNRIFVLNYAKYQDIDFYKKDTKSHGKSQALAKQKPSTSQAILEECNKNISKDIFTTPSVSDGSVSISKSVLEELSAIFGEVEVQMEVEAMKDWCGSKGKKYKNYGLALKEWLRRDYGVPSADMVLLGKLTKSKWSELVKNNPKAIKVLKHINNDLYLDIGIDNGLINNLI